MPSLTYGAGHWASFANGAKQLAYTFNFGGGFSATLALQDYEDTNHAARGVALALRRRSRLDVRAPAGTYYVYNSIPQINGRLDWTQGWGEVALTGAWANLPFVNATPRRTIGTSTCGPLAVPSRSTCRCSLRALLCG